MDEWMIILIAGAIVFTTFTVEGIAGFGATVMALPFVAMLIGIDKAVPMLSSLGVLVSFFIVLRSWRDLDWKEYLFIVLHVGIGVPCGLFMMDFLPKEWLIAILVCFMFFAGIKGLCGVLRKSSVPRRSPMGKKNLLSRLVLILGGVIQGAFSSGGPVIVIYAARALPEKTKFRVTLSMLWMTVNVVMLTKWTIMGTVWTPALGRQILCAIPFVICGVFTGDFLHHKVNERNFRIIVYSILMIAALSLGGNLLRNMF